MFRLDGKRALLIGYEGNFGPIFIEALTEAGCYVVVCVGLPDHDISCNSGIIGAMSRMSMIGVPDIVVCNAAIDISPSKKDARFFTDFNKKILQKTNRNVVHEHLFTVLHNEYHMIPNSIGTM